MKFFLFIISLVICSSVGFSQSTTDEQSPNLIEVNYPQYFFYGYLGNTFHLSTPLVNIGVSYTRSSPDKFGFNVSLEYDHFNKRTDSFGEFFTRRITNISVGLNRSFTLIPYKLSLLVNADIIGRFGGFSIHVATNSFETKLGYYVTRDIGNSIGTKLLYKTNKKLFFSVGFRQSYFFYLRDKGYEPYNIESSPRHLGVFTLGVGLGL